MSDVLARILVAVDGSDAGDRAASLAIGLGLSYEAELLLCYAIDRAGAFVDAPIGGGPFAPSGFGEMDAAANSILDAVVQRATQAGVRVTTTVLEGRAAGAIVACAEECAVDAIVMGTQGKHGLERLFLGSTAEGVLRLAGVPVFVVPPLAAGDVVPSESSDLSTTGFRRILVAVDHSDPADAAAAFALALASTGTGRLVYCSVIETGDLLDKAMVYGYDPTPMLDDMRHAAHSVLAAVTARATSRGVGATGVTAEGKPIVEIINTAAADGADLIAIGTHGRRAVCGASSWEASRRAWSAPRRFLSSSSAAMSKTRKNDAQRNSLTASGVTTGALLPHDVRS